MRRAGTIRVVGILAALALLAGCTGGAGGSGTTGGNGAAAATFSKSFGGPLHDEARAAIQTRDGGYLFAGQLDGKRQSEGGVWLNKLDASGDVQWQRAIRPRSAELNNFTVVRRAADGNYLIAGENYSDAGTQLSVTKLTASGQLVWQRPHDSGPWVQYAFAGPQFGRGAYTEDVATDLWPLPDGGALMTGVSLGNLLVSQGDDGEFRPTAPGAGGAVFIDAKSVIVMRVGADGSLLWKTRLTDGQFTSRTEDALIAKIRATADQGAILAYPVHDQGDRKLRIVRLGQLGELLWQREEDGISVSDLEQTADAVEAGRSPDGIANDGFIVTIGLDDHDLERESQPIQPGEEDEDDDGVDPKSRVVKLDDQGQVQWRRRLDHVDLATVTQVCVPAASAEGFTCSYAVAGTICVDENFGGPPDKCDFKRAYAQRLDAGGQPTLDESAATNASFWRVVDTVKSTDGRYVVGLARGGPASRGARRIVLDSSTLEWLVSGALFETPYWGSYSLAAPDQAIWSDAWSTVIRVSFPELLSSRFVEEQTVTRWADRSQLYGRVAGIAEVANDSYVLVGGEDDGDEVVWAARFTAGQIDWQRELRNGSASLSAALAMTASGDGGVVVATRTWTRETYLAKLTATGEVAWTSERLSGDEERMDVIELHHLPGGGYVALGRIIPDHSVHEGRLAALYLLDDTGRLTWRQRYGQLPTGEIEPSPTLPLLRSLEADSMALAADGGFVLASRTRYMHDGLAAVWKTDAKGEILWTRRIGLRGATSDAVRIRATPDGGYVLGLAEEGAIAPDAVGVPHGQRNLLLVKLDAQGNPLWTRSYGAFLDETLHDLRVLDDGGLLVAGRSYSLGENSEAWLLRLDADGMLAAGCNAHLGSLPVEAFTQSPLNVRSPSPLERVIAPAAPLTFSSEATNALPETADVTVARQCFGVAPPAEPPPVQPTFTLTLTQPGSLTGVVVSTPAGIVCGTAASPPPCSASFPADSDVFLTYELNSAQNFLRFEDCDEIIPDASGPASCRVRMTRDRTVRAIFGEPRDRFRLSMTVNGIGTVRSGDEDGISCGQFYGDDQDCEHFYEPFLAGGTLPTTISLSVYTNAEGFLGWGGDCAAFGTANGFNLTMDSDKNCIANFAEPPGGFDLTVQTTGIGTGSVLSAPVGISCGDTCTASFAPNQTVRLLATEGINSSFASWTGCDRLVPPPSGSIAICEVDMTRARGVEAEFDYAVGGQYLLEFIVTGDDGIVESTDHAIICTSAGPDCQEHYLPGVSVGISYNLLRGGGTFLGWGGDCANFGLAGTNHLLMNGDKHCTAQFSSPPPTQFTLNVLKVGPTSTVRSVPAGIDCGPTCSASYNAGQRVLLEVIPGAGFNFNGWSGCSRQPPGANFWPDCEVEMTSNRTVQVNIE